MTKKPSYRFEDYTESWEEKKLGEVNDVRDGTHDSPKYVQDVYPLVTSKNLTSEGLDFSDISFISEVDYISINKRSKVETGDIIFGMIGTIGNPVLLKIDGFAIKNVALLKKGGFIDNSFLIQLLQSSSFIKYISLENAGGTQKFLGLSQIRNFQLFSPSLPEQTAIGSFFQDIDQLISLQQRKLEVLKEQKKTYLKLLFPAKGQTKPALRFAGFEDDWKEVKLGEVTELKRGLTYKPTSVVENGTRVLRSSNIDGDVFKKQEDDIFVEDSSVTIPYVQFGDILITAANGSSKLVGKHAIIEDSEKMVHGGFMLLARSKQYKFLNALLSSEWYSRFINVSVSGGNGAIGNLSKSNLEKEIVLCPTIPEQEAIGSFFQDLDKAIAKQEEKVTQLKESKPTLLRKMFS